MTRAYQQIAVYICALAILAWTSTQARAAAGPTIVYPTGHFPEDVENVQAAVDAGGAVMLKATDVTNISMAFNFGPATEGSGAVYLTKDVTISGETVSGHMTTVAGGDAPFQIYDPVRVAFRGLSFDGPRVAAVFSLAIGGFEFTNSRVAHVTPFFWYTDPDTGEDIYKGQCLWIQALGNSSGSLIIRDNAFKDCGLNGAQLGYGLAIVPTVTTVSIARNIIRGANLAGIILIWPGADTVIEDNIIVPGPGDITNRSWGNGIHLLGAWNRVQETPVVIRNNDINVEGPEAHGVFAFGDQVYNYGVQHTVVEGNRIAVHGGWAGIGLWGLVSNSDVRHNQLRGDAQYALLLGAGFFDASDQAVSNQFVGNNISTFDASVADVFFDTNTVDNVLRGHSGDVIDLGTGNRITGTKKDRSNLPTLHMRNRRTATGWPTSP